MVKKVGIHLDAIIMAVLLLAASIGFNIYQRYQFHSLLREHVDLTWHAQDADTQVILLKGKLGKCEHQEKPAADKVPTTSAAP